MTKRTRKPVTRTVRQIEKAGLRFKCQCGDVRPIGAYASAHLQLADLPLSGTCGECGAVQQIVANPEDSDA